LIEQKHQDVSHVIFRKLLQDICKQSNYFKVYDLLVSQTLFTQ